MGKILVTGGCGYIGSHTLIELLNQGRFDVISADNLLNSSIRTLDRIEQITGQRVKNYQTDLCNLAETQKVFEENSDIVGVIHFAALKAVGDSVNQPLEYYQNNFVSMMNVMKCCADYGVPNFIFSSSCSIYGNIEKLPVTEATPISEAESPYANTKKVGERIIRDFARVHPDTQTIALRYFNPVGAHKSGLNGEDPINKPTNLVPVITQTASGIIQKLSVFGGDYDTRDGSCIRDYIHVTDIALAHIKALNYLMDGKNESNYEVYNLGSGEGISVLEAIKTFEAVTGLKLNYEVGPRRAGDVVAIYSDSSLAKEKLGWEAERGIEEMMTSAWKWQSHLNSERMEA